MARGLAGVHNYWMVGRPTGYNDRMFNMQPPPDGLPPQLGVWSGNARIGYRPSPAEWAIVGGLGDVDVAAQARQDALTEFSQVAANLMTQVNIAFQRLAQSGVAQDIVNTLGNNIATLSAIGQQVYQGDVNQVTSYGKVAAGLIGAMNDLSNASIWDNWPSLSDWLQQILNIPVKLEAALLAIARTAGKTVREVAAGVGVDTSQLPNAGGELADKIIWGLFGLGVAYFVVNKLWK